MSTDTGIGQKSEMKTRRALILSILSVIMILSGFERKTVELQNNAKTPLIDLDKAIDRAKWGVDESTGKSGSSVSGDTVSADGASDETGTGADIGGKLIRVEVRGKKIKADGKEMEDTDELKRYLETSIEANDMIQLTDGYADSDTYKETAKIVKTFAGTKGISVTGDYIDE